MVHNVALVLGGGGAAGQAWQIGVIAGLDEAGLDLTEAADLVVGTSSGATTAAQVRSGIPAAELLASVLSPPVQPVGQNREQPPSLPMATVFERMRAIGAAATSADDLRPCLGLCERRGALTVRRTEPDTTGTGADPAGQFEGLRRPPGADLASQVEALRKQGSHVELITPDAGSRAAMGTNQMDPATRIPAARAGFAQGKQEATRVMFP